MRGENKEIKVLIAAGGSAGHLYPAIAFAQRLVQMNPRATVAFASSRRGQVEEWIKQSGFEVFFVSIRALSPGVFNVLRFLYSLCKSFLEAFLIIEKFRPDAVVGFGSYVSLPLVLEAAAFKRITVIHEQNVSLGRANQFLSHFADKIALSFRKARLLNHKYVFTGNPLRRDLIKAGKKIAFGDNLLGDFRSAPYTFLSAKKEAADFFGLAEDKFTVLTVGGSQGSKRINREFKEAVFSLSGREDFQFIHICGKYDYSLLKKEYSCIRIRHCLFEFLAQMRLAYSLADLVVCRAGAGTISELAYFNKAAILIPYPYAGAHQLENALALRQVNAAVVIEEKDLTVKSLVDNISGLIRSKDSRRALERNIQSFAVPDADKKLAEAVLGLMG